MLIFPKNHRYVAAIAKGPSARHRKSGNSMSMLRSGILAFSLTFPVSMYIIEMVRADESALERLSCTPLQDAKVRQPPFMRPGVRLVIGAWKGSAATSKTLFWTSHAFAQSWSQKTRSPRRTNDAFLSFTRFPHSASPQRLGIMPRSLRVSVPAFCVETQTWWWFTFLCRGTTEDRLDASR